MSDALPANLETLLGRLADSIRHGVIPRVDDEFARAELFSLASILRILAAELPTIDDRRTEEETRIAEVLARLGVVEGKDMDGDADIDSRRAMMTGPEASGDPAAKHVLRTFNQVDTETGISSLLSPRRSREALPRTTTWRSLRAEVGILSPLLCEMVGLPSGTPVDYAWNTEGFAAETVTATLARPGGEPMKVVVRAQWPERPLSALFLSPHDQFMLLDGLRRTGRLQVPKVHGVVGPDQGLGTDAIVMEHVDGRIPTNWTPAGKVMMEELRDAGALGAYLGDLTALQSSPWRDFGVSAFSPGTSPVDRYRDKVNVWADAYRGAVLRPDPLMDETIRALLEHDAAGDTEVLVHGDFRPGNTIYLGDDVGSAVGDAGPSPRTCVIDWSDATIGDIHEDLGVGVMWAHRDDAGRAMGLADPRELVAGYETIAGRPVDPRRLLEAELLAAFRRCVGFHLLARNWVDRGGDVRMARAWLALVEDRRQLNRILEQIDKMR